MSEAITQAAAYDLIDRFLRNNLYDDDYAKYSEALEALSQPAPSPQAPGRRKGPPGITLEPQGHELPAVPVVSDEQIKETIDCIDWSQMVTADDYMYMIARAILALRPADHPDTQRCLKARNDLNAALHGEGALIDDLENAVANACAKLRRQAVEPMTDDTARLDYLQERGATVDLLTGIVGFTPMQFRIGGLHAAVNSDIRKAIDAARGITAKAEVGA